MKSFFYIIFAAVSLKLYEEVFFTGLFKSLTKRKTFWKTKRKSFPKQKTFTGFANETMCEKRMTTLY